MRSVALVDLDDTLFQTIRKCPPGLDPAALTPLAYASDGSPLGFATPRQMHFLQWLSETTHLVPVTARSLDALRRVRIPFAAAVCAHGGVVLDEESKADALWSSQITQEAAIVAPMLATLVAAIQRAALDQGSDLAVRVLSEGATGLYVLAKHPSADEAALHAAVDAVVGEVPMGWTIHRNGNNVALMPPYLGKQHAVAYLLPALRARFPDAPIIGIGDSLTDAPFMALCDYAMMPTGSQLAMVALHA